MFYHPEKRLIFLAHPRGGSRTIRETFKLVGFEEVGAHHEPPNPRIFQMDLLPHCTLVTNTRNHYDAWTSWFFAAMGQADDALSQWTPEWCADWIEGNPHGFKLPRMWRFLGDFPGIEIIRFENLREEVFSFLDRFELKPPRFFHEGKNQFREGRRYQDVMPEEVRRFISYTFKDEIEELGYSY